MSKLLSLKGRIFNKIGTTRKRDVFLISLLAVLTAGIFVPFDRFNVTTSESMRNRVYWISNSRDVRRGDTILFSDSNIATKYKRMNLTKFLACDEGDLLEVNGFKEFYCNKHYIGRGKDFSIKGGKMEHFVYNGIIPPGKMFVMGQHKDSYDSRYRGLLDKSAVISKQVPLF